ncbi:hypothetical protein V7S43_009925 [Phytophthora oleae]|uniref:Uncharacterized protein n=1 Tax=Phytophthora oleae TaxID=2107226 RepID=A0ABD3FEC8_9STRA
MIKSISRLRKEDDANTRTRMSADDVTKKERANLLSNLLQSRKSKKTQSMKYGGAYGSAVRPFRFEKRGGETWLMSEEKYQAKLTEAAKKDQELSMNVKTLMKKLQKSAKAKETS